MKWIAKYFNGEELHEIDKEGNEHNFKDIEIKRVGDFGIEFNKNWFYFNTLNGNFSFNGKTLGIGIITFDEHLKTLYKLSDRSDINYSKLIQFKKAHADWKPSGSKGLTNTIESINFGYETRIKLLMTEINFKPIVCIPADGQYKPYVTINLKSTKVFEGELFIVYNDTQYTYPIRFNKPHSEGKLNFMIK